MLSRRGDEEVVVLEVAEHAEVAGEREEEQRLALGRASRVRQMRTASTWFQSVQPASRKHEPPVPPAVEDVARDDDERPPAVRPRHRQPRERQDEQEEDREGGGREEHARGSLGDSRGAGSRRATVPWLRPDQRSAGDPAVASTSSRRGGRRVTAVAESAAAGVEQRVLDRRAEPRRVGSPAGAAARARRRAAPCRRSAREAAHSISATSTQAPTMTPRDRDRVEVGDRGGRGCGGEEEASSRSRGSCGRRRAGASSAPSQA